MVARGSGDNSGVATGIVDTEAAQAVFGGTSED